MFASTTVENTRSTRPMTNRTSYTFLVRTILKHSCYLGHYQIKMKKLMYYKLILDTQKPILQIHRNTIITLITCKNFYIIVFTTLVTKLFKYISTFTGITSIIISNSVALRLISDEMYPKDEGGLVKVARAKPEGLLLNLPRLINRNAMLSLCNIMGYRDNRKQERFQPIQQFQMV